MIGRASASSEDIANVLMVADRMLELMASAATTESAMSWGVANEFQTLEKIISDIKAELIDAERLHGAMDNRMKELLRRVEHSVYEADDVLDGFFAVALGPRFMSPNKTATKVRSFFSLTSSNPLVFRIKMVYEMKKVRTALDEALSLAKELHELQETRQETRPIFVREEDVVGRDFDKGEIMKLVLEGAHTKTESEQKLRVVSVVGVEGIGKTTLAQLVYSDAEIKKSFDLRMWVCISDLADTRLIEQKLIESAKDEKVQCDYLQKDRLQEQLRKTINRKSFFLVLDNVRDENRANWMSLRNLLTGHTKGGTVLVTTRSKKVAKITRTVAQSYHLGPLKDADSLFLLETMALGISEDQNSIRAFKEMGRQIAGKCKGVPRVIQNVGSSMAHKSVAEWQSFLHKEIDEVMREISYANSLTTVALKKVTEGLDNAIFSASGSHLLRKTIERATQETCPIFLREGDIIGRDSDQKEITKLVLQEAAANESAEQKLIRVISVVGPEGIGKTTLAQLVYNDAAVASHFNLRMWVCVSGKVDMRLIIQKLIESAEDQKVRDDNLQIDHLQEQLQETLNGKRFFLVLDDVGDRLQANWVRLRNLLMAGENGSTVLVTTCSKKVAKITCTVSQSYHLGHLNDADSLFLLESVALGFSADRELQQAFQEIGREIAQKCNGVPLVIQTVGSSMACRSVNEWQSFLYEKVYSFVPDEEVIGRDANKEAIMKHLLGHNNSGENELVIIICGIAGVGKTALAQLIFNDSEVQDYFDLKIWVPVTDVFDLKVIKEKILVSLTTTDPGQLRVEELESLIRQEILGKRCLLILDGLQNVESGKWLLLRSLLSIAANGSRVIVTTRNENLAVNTEDKKQTHQLEPLDEDSSWTLFVKVAFKIGKQRTNSKIIKIGKEIVAKCGGIPFAIRTIGGILHFKHTEREWQLFYENELPKMLKRADIGDSPELIYEQLPYFLKPCFAYCALFPMGYEFDVQTLINLWISQGFIRQESDLSHEAAGYRYFAELLRRSFFQETLRDGLDNITKCKMKNFMCADLAKRVAQDVCATLGLKDEISGTNPCHISFDFHLDSSWHIRPLARSKRIRSLILPRQIRQEVEGRSSEYVCEEITKFKYLRMLDLHNSGIKVVSDSIGDLKHLRYLDLSQNISIKALPNSIGRLWNLQTLKLNHCGNLQELPRAITKLVNLRNLENESCYSLRSMPRGIGELTSLQRLSEFVLCNDTDSVSNKSGKLDELQELNALSGKLKIKNLRRFGGDETRARLKEKEHLVSLVLIWDAEASNHTVDCEKSLEDLQPHPKLRELSLSAYVGVRFSSWLSKHENLVKFSLSRCTNCKFLPPLHHLPRLEVLLVDDLPELKYISEGRSKNKLEAFFPYLKELQLTNMPKLARWWKPAARIEEKKFPSLSKLIIEDCPNLISMPLFPTLEGLLVLNNTKWEPFQETIAAPQIPSTKSEASSSTSSTDVALSKLKTLHIINMPNGGPNTWQSFSSLRSLTLDHVQDIDTFLQGLHKQVTNPQEEKATNLQELHIWRCARLKDISLIKDIKSLRILSLKLCPNLKVPREKICFIISLQKVEIEECPHLSHIQRMLEDRSYEK